VVAIKPDGAFIIESVHAQQIARKGPLKIEATGLCNADAARTVERAVIANLGPACDTNVEGA
jgi:hypothetical protein